MTSVDETLWLQVTHDPAAKAALAVEQPKSPRLNARLTGLAAAVACGVALFGTTVLHGSGPAAAYAVVENADGSITLTLKEITGVAPANERLAALGASVRIAPSEATCPESGASTVDRNAAQQLPLVAEPLKAPANAAEISWTVHPEMIPSGDTLMISAQAEQSGSLLGARSRIGLYRGAAPLCVSALVGP